jgi:Tfp pilus assembly protein PilN
MPVRQQINLYQTVFRHERKPFSGVLVASVLGLVVTALAAFSMYADREVSALQAEVATLHEQQAQQQAQLAKLEELRGQHPADGNAQAEVKSLTAALAERQQALQVLKSGAAGQTTGFASRLEALARRHVEGLWIDSLAMSGTRNTMSMSGGSVNAGIVPIYLRGLSGEPVLSGTRFDDFTIERPLEGPDAEVRFHAGSSSLPVRRTENLASVP